MKPEIGRYVKCIFRNNTTIEGIVQSWTDQQSILRSINSKNILIIQNTAADIMLVKIIVDQAVDKIESEPVLTEKPKTLEQVREENSKGIPFNPLNPAHAKSLAELKIQLDKEEREIIANKLKSHTISEPRRTIYEHPRVIKKPMSK